MKFEPPLEDLFEARKRVMEWKDMALEHFDSVSVAIWFGLRGPAVQLVNAGIWH